MAYSKFRPRCLVFPWICQLLLRIHMELFEDCVAAYLTHQEKSNICWTIKADTTFTQLKEAFASALILAHIDPKMPFTIEVDA